MSFTVRRLSDRKRSWSVGKALLLGAASLAQPLFKWMLHRAQEKHDEQERHGKRVHIMQRTLIIACAVVLCLLLVVGIAQGLVALRVISIRSILTVSAGTIPTDAYGHTNILLLGAGDASHDGVDLTDSIMIASIDPAKTKSVALLSLPRDLYFLQTENMGKGRINSLYRDYKYYLMNKGSSAAEASTAALQELRKEVGAALGIDIQHVVKVDFIGFVQAVDALGGVDVAVPADLVDPEYPGPNYTYTTFTLPAGIQHLDGETALKYARSRHSTSDFDRSARQQQLLQALSDTVREQGFLTRPNRLVSLLRIMQEHVEMSFDMRTILGLAKAALEVERNRIISLQLNNQNGLYGELSIPGGLLYNPPRDQFEGASVLLPVSIPEFPVTWKQVRLLVRFFIHEREAHVARRSIAILNAGAPSGSGRKIASELARFGFMVDRVENAGIDDIPSSTVSAPADPALEAFFAQILQMKQAPLPSTLGPDKAAPITIVLGEDYRYRPLQDLVPALQ